MKISNIIFLLAIILFSTMAIAQENSNDSGLNAEDAALLEKIRTRDASYKPLIVGSKGQYCFFIGDIFLRAADLRDNGLPPEQTLRTFDLYSSPVGFTISRSMIKKLSIWCISTQLILMREGML